MADEEKEYRSVLSLSMLHQIRDEMDRMHVVFLQEKDAEKIGAARMQVLQLPITTILRNLGSLEETEGVGRTLARAIRGSLAPHGAGLAIAAINIHVSRGVLIVHFTTISQLVGMLPPPPPSPTAAPADHPNNTRRKPSPAQESE